MLFRRPDESSSGATAPTGDARPRSSNHQPPMERHGSTGAGLPSWAPQRQAHNTPQRKAPTEENSDSDDDGSVQGDEFVGFSPISKTMLTTICVFGADGNLASKKILPTLFQLWKRKLMPRDVLIFGYARADITTEQWRKQVFRCIYNPTQPQGERKAFLQRCHFKQGQFNEQASIDALMKSMEEEEAKRLVERANPGGSSALNSSDGFNTMGNNSKGKEAVAATQPPTTPAKKEQEQVRMYYMAVPPFLYSSICGCLRTYTGPAGMVGLPVPTGGVRTVERFVLEKPFGRDLESCRALNRELSMLREDETYRIDHYLGKELVMNLLVLRFANVAFSSIWNRQNIKAVQVIFKEDFGTEGRGGTPAHHRESRTPALLLPLCCSSAPLSFSHTAPVCSPLSLQATLTNTA